MTAATDLWLDKKILEQWLQTPVDDCIKKEYTGQGDNYLSDLHKLVVKTKKGDKFLIIKCRLETGEAADRLDNSSIFHHEEVMYGDTLPRMSELLRDALPDDKEPLAPICYYSCRNFLVMEDLTQSGYKMMSRREGLGLHECLLTMRALAKFHAASIALHEQDPSSMQEYDRNFFDEQNSQMAWAHYFEGLVNMLVEELETWPAEQWAPYIEKLQRIQPGFQERLVEVTKKNNEDFNVLIHGDLWVNNVLFKGDAVRLIDFQMVHFTTPVIDLHLFFMTSPNMEVRVNHFDRLVEEYQATLSSAMSALGCHRSCLTLEELYDKLSKKSFYGVFGLVSEAAVMLAEPHSGFGLSEAMKGIFPGRKMYTEYYKKAVKWALPLLDKMGAFDVK